MAQRSQPSKATISTLLLPKWRTLMSQSRTSRSRRTPSRSPHLPAATLRTGSRLGRSCSSSVASLQCARSSYAPSEASRLESLRRAWRRRRRRRRYCGVAPVVRIPSSSSSTSTKHVHQRSLARFVGRRSLPCAQLHSATRALEGGRDTAKTDCVTHFAPVSMTTSGMAREEILSLRLTAANPAPASHRSGQVLAG